MRTDTLLVSGVLMLLLSCGAPQSYEPCVCDVPIAQGNQALACGQTQCVNGVTWSCSGPTPSLVSQGACQPACTPKVCGGAGAVCGSVSDGCGGTLNCGGCTGGLTCQAGACVASACQQQGLVCGTVQGVDCGTCPGTSTCSSTGRACVEQVATLPFYQYSESSALVGDTLYVAGPLTQGATTSSVVAVTLSTGAVRTVASGLTDRSPLAANSSSVFWSSSTGMSKVAAGSTTVETVPNFNEFCTSLVADSARLYCGQGGSATYGVQFWGIKTLPISGGPATWLVRNLNYPHMAISSGMLFHVGTTDNQYSFSVLGMTPLPTGTEQSLVSGGSLDSSFVKADAHAFYFSQRATAGATLTRVPFDNSPDVDVLTSTQGFDSDTTAFTTTEAWAMANISGQQGLWKVPLTGGAPTLVAKNADVGNAQYSAQALLRGNGAWVLTAGTKVYRLHGEE